MPATHKTIKNPEDAIHFFVSRIIIIRSAFIINNTMTGVMINDNHDKMSSVFAFNFIKSVRVSK